MRESIMILVRIASQSARRPFRSDTASESCFILCSLCHDGTKYSSDSPINFISRCVNGLHRPTLPGYDSVFALYSFGAFPSVDYSFKTA